MEDLVAALSRAEAQMDARPLSERVGIVERLRSGFTEMGIVITQDDEKVLALYVEGVLDFRHLGDQFDARIFAAGKEGR